MNKLEKFENKYPYFWLVLGLILTLFSYGIFNTGICAWILAIPLIRFINKNLKWTSISADILEQEKLFLTMLFQQLWQQLNFL